MKYSFHPSARAELNDSIDYYEDYRPGLGLEFAEEVYSTIHASSDFLKLGHDSPQTVEGV